MSVRTTDDTLDARLKTLLPAEYHAAYEKMEPKPMGSAALRYQMDGRVAWDELPTTRMQTELRRLK